MTKLVFIAVLVSSLAARTGVSAQQNPPQPAAPAPLGDITPGSITCEDVPYP
jgi:hypothetical protein